MVEFDPLVLVEGSNVFMANCMKIFMGEFGPVNGDIEPREMDYKCLLISGAKVRVSSILTIWFFLYLMKS